MDQYQQTDMQVTTSKWYQNYSSQEQQQIASPIMLCSQCVQQTFWQKKKKNIIFHNIL